MTELIDAKMFVPTKAFLTKGVGRHREKLTSFEMALRDAHLAAFNLVRVSSIFPPQCELVDREEGLSHLLPGQVLFAVGEPAPGVRDLSEFGFPLKGGRLEYVAQRPAAALVYQRRQHFINLMLWPSVEERDRAPSTLTRRGYNLIHWTKAGMTYWAVSDLNSSELEQFAQLVQNQTLFP